METYPPDRVDLCNCLKALETRLADEIRQVEATQEEILRLKATIVAITPAGNLPEPTPGPASRDAKVALFRSLFRGREDVYPRYWENPKKKDKNGKILHGYKPVCANEKNRTLCDWPRVKCGECPNRSFAHLDDQAILDHLQGRHTLGVYAMLKDETCWFLAADFDKADWQEDVQAVLDTCRELAVPALVERSRSGNGAHLWIFFSAPIPAATARKLGCLLLTETMDRRPQLKMTSYDRLFPNQDNMPEGGFGNLIALPLQLTCRAKGNTLFLDEALEPWPDPWSVLAAQRRMDPDEVERMVGTASHQGRILGVRMDPLEDGLEATPWERPPSGKARRPRIVGTVPSTIRAILAKQIFVEKAGLPSALLAELKRLAAFQNPEFYKKQGMRFSTWDTPRIICSAEEHDQHLALPRGCREDLEALLADLGSRLVVEEQRNPGTPVEWTFQGRLTAMQQQAVETMQPFDLGIFVAPPGSGKTVFGAYMAALRGVNTLVLVHRKPLLDQWRSQLQRFLGLGAKEVGQIGGGRQKATGCIDVAMIQSLASRESVSDLVGQYGQVIIDECHHAPALSFERVMREVRAKHVLGLTATPYRRDGLQRLLHFHCGPVRFQARRGSGGEEPAFTSRLVVRETRFNGQGTIQDLYGALVTDPFRNNLIIRDVRRTLEEGRSPIVLTERREHLDLLAGALRDAAWHVVVLHGGVSAKLRRAALERLAQVPPDEPRLILATGRYIGEGFDDPRLDTLFMAMPIAWKGTLIQYAGRLHREHPGKREVRIYDYLDDSLPVFRKMFEKRMKGYRAMGYETLEEGARMPLFPGGDVIQPDF